MKKKNLDFLILFGLSKNVNDKTAYYEYNQSFMFIEFALEKSKNSI